MNKREKEIKRYSELNQLAQPGGIVIFGGEDDLDIPLCELKQAFDLDVRIYNRSIGGLSLDSAAEIYDLCVSPLKPDTVLLHIGADDIDMFRTSPPSFEQKYLSLISHIRYKNPGCRIGILSLRNYDNNNVTEELNRRLRYISQSENCEFGDISDKTVWNPHCTQDIVSFVHSYGYVRPLSRKRPVSNLVNLLFCCEPTGF
ncbi:MAG: SGNH/GDSL hydrolase family protein [Firmicutes bacterium]|nr:SGNH/GDSL hydrolase family protein [Bacillota bacterium]